MTKAETTFWQLLKRRFGDSCWLNEPLWRHTAYRVGGPADAFIKPATLQDLQEVIHWCYREGVPFQVLGKGANVLVHDRGYRGVILSLETCCGDIRRKGRVLTVGAGVPVQKLVAYCEERGLAGLQFMSGIPGTVGGALMMNAGAFGGEIGDRVLWVEALNRQGRRRRISREQAGFGYRRATGLRDLILLGCRLHLEEGSPDQLRQQRQAIVLRREKNQPLDYPSCGSVFKRPPGEYAGRLIERAGAKGLRVGGAMVSPKHANFILNVAGATARDIFHLIVTVQQRVYRQTGVWLAPEVKFIGFSEQELQQLEKPENGTTSEG